jgi:putative aldouronate transport system substrate-binding protein
MIRAKLYGGFLLATLLGFALFAGCTGKQQGGGEGEVVLRGWGSFTFDDTTGLTSFSDQIAWQEITRKTGIRVDWTTVTALANNDNIQFGLLMASGDLPDFFASIRPVMYEQYGRMGALLPLEDIIKTSIPNLDRFLVNDPEVRGSVTSPDGRIFFVPRIMPPETRNYQGFYIRKDWLELVGLPPPDTVDELYATLVAFRDRIPGATKPFTSDPRPLIYSWGVGTRANGNMNDDTFVEDGQIKFGPTDPRFRQALQFINRMYSEGLLDPEYMGITNAQLTTNFMTNASGAAWGSWSGFLQMLNNLYNRDGRGEPLIALAPLAGPTGFRGTQGRHPAIDLITGGAIASSSRRVDDVARLFNFLYSDEGITTFYYGVEGDTYRMVAGVPTYTEKVTTSPLGLLGFVNNYIGHLGRSNTLYPVSVYYSILSPEGIRGVEMSTANMGTIKVPALRFTEQEVMDINAILQDINTYVDTNVAAFITGSRNINSNAEWNAFVAGFDRLRLTELLRHYNASYQRFLQAQRS